MSDNDGPAHVIYISMIGVLHQGHGYMQLLFTMGLSNRYPWIANNDNEIEYHCYGIIYYVHIPHHFRIPRARPTFYILSIIT